MYEIVVLETARFRSAQYKNFTRGSVFEKKKNRRLWGETRIAPFFWKILVDMRGRPNSTVYTKANVRQRSERPSRDCIRDFNIRRRGGNENVA